MNERDGHRSCIMALSQGGISANKHREAGTTQGSKCAEENAFTEVLCWVSGHRPWAQGVGCSQHELLDAYSCAHSCHKLLAWQRSCVQSSIAARGAWRIPLPVCLPMALDKLLQRRPQGAALAAAAAAARCCAALLPVCQLGGLLAQHALRQQAPQRPVGCCAARDALRLSQLTPGGGGIRGQHNTLQRQACQLDGCQGAGCRCACQANGRGRRQRNAQVCEARGDPAGKVTGLGCERFKRGVRVLWRGYAECQECCMKAAVAGAWAALTRSVVRLEAVQRCAHTACMGTSSRRRVCPS